MRGGACKSPRVALTAPPLQQEAVGGDLAPQSWVGVSRARGLHRRSPPRRDETMAPSAARRRACDTGRARARPRSRWARRVRAEGLRTAHPECAQPNAAGKRFARVRLEACMSLSFAGAARRPPTLKSAILPRQTFLFCVRSAAGASSAKAQGEGTGSEWRERRGISDAGRQARR